MRRRSALSGFRLMIQARRRRRRRVWLVGDRFDVRRWFRRHRGGWFADGRRRGDRLGFGASGASASASNSAKAVGASPMGGRAAAVRVQDRSRQFPPPADRVVQAILVAAALAAASVRRARRCGGTRPARSARRGRCRRQRQPVAAPCGRCRSRLRRRPASARPARIVEAGLDQILKAEQGTRRIAGADQDAVTGKRRNRHRETLDQPLQPVRQRHGAA